MLYRDTAGQLKPHLSSLSLAIMVSGRTPPCFTKAEVYCKHKVAHHRSGLDCRPNSLLKGGYKLLSRILANWLCHHLENIVHETQNGFVPRMDIHDTLDILTAAWAFVDTSEALATLTVLLLDFNKAYDSLNREFLEAALQHHQLPQTSISVVMALRENTTAEFLANDYFLREVPMRTGIRQGCLLAPLLFCWLSTRCFDENKHTQSPGCHRDRSI